MNDAMAQEGTVFSLPDAIHKAESSFQDKDFREAAELFGAVLKKRGLAAPHWVMFGICMREMNRPHAALGCYKNAVEAGIPEGGGHHSRMANVYLELNHYDKALKHGRRSIELSDDPGIWRNYAVLLREMKQYHLSIEIYEKLIKENPSDKSLDWDLAFVRMYLGQDAESWQLYESRYEAKKIPEHPIMDMVPRWHGESLHGKRLYLVGEQGFGDTILMLRFIPVLKEMGAQITLECKPELRRIASTLPVDEWVEPKNVGEGCHDYYIGLMSLPGRLGIRTDEIPPPYPLKPPQEVQEEVAQRPWFPDDEKLNIGIVWSGSIKFSDNRKRSVNVGRFLDLAAASENCRWFSLQKGPREPELHQAAGSLLIRDLAPQLTDFAVTAAVIENLDLIVMTDSSVAHLAASQGKPVLNLLHYKPYWLYMPETPTSRWYPSMRFLRQTEPGGWDRVFNDAADILSHLAKEKQTEGKLTAEKTLGIIDSCATGGL